MLLLRGGALLTGYSAGKDEKWKLLFSKKTMGEIIETGF